MITVQFKLLPTPEQEQLLKKTSLEYISSVNDLLDYVSGQVSIPKLSSASYNADLPSAVKNEVVNTVKSIYKKFKQGKCDSLPVLRKPVITWNNQNYKLADRTVEFPVSISSKSQRISVKAVITDYQFDRLSGKLGSLRITQKNGKWVAQIAVNTTDEAKIDTNIVMGIDLGLKVPAVAVTDTSKTKFFGNGRQNKYIKRNFRSKRRKLGKAKKQKAINKLNNKEQRWMRDCDHKISREIINFAVANNVSVIRMEQLTNIRTTARTSRKNEKNLHTWSFYRLSQYTEYKANLAGIKVEYVNPKYTSQICPICGIRNHAKDRKYSCSCGYHTHRDRVGAVNIISAPVIVGNRQSA